ncbi:MAG: hypothetical protein U0984_15240 [Prosthecobacter sp.]|nr:hypothetical protein [Prosthecobacter sp.]
MSWYPFDNGKSIGLYGSESGSIVRDEEHGDGVRITLERGGYTAPFSITCGIYGWMVHTRFFGTESEAQGEFESMRAELSKIIGAIPFAADPEDDSKTEAVVEEISEFVRRFP